MNKYSTKIFDKNNLSIVATISKMETVVNKEIKRLQLKGGINE